MVVMIETYRSALIWNLFMSDEELKPALDRIGFQPNVEKETSTKA